MVIPSLCMPLALQMVWLASHSTCCPCGIAGNGACSTIPRSASHTKRRRAKDMEKWTTRVADYSGATFCKKWGIPSLTGAGSTAALGAGMSGECRLLAASGQLQQPTRHCNCNCNCNSDPTQAFPPVTGMRQSVVIGCSPAALWRLTRPTFADRHRGPRATSIRTHQSHPQSL